jgi:hypothetical protein
MPKRVLACGLSGGFVLIAWTALLNVGFGFSQSVQMKRVANEAEVYVVLKESVTQPGAYVLNPAPEAGRGFPRGEPVFGLQYSGIGHEAAGAMLLLELAVGLAAALAVAALLSMAAPSVLCRYVQKVVFVSLIGVVIAVFSGLQRFGIGGYPLDSALAIAARDLAGWLLAGLVMGWLMKPVASPTATP